MPARMLVIDDDQATCRMLELRLQSEGHEVLTTASAVQALEQAGRFELHVVLTDLNMVGLSGIELCKKFNESWPDVPVMGHHRVR